MKHYATIFIFYIGLLCIAICNVYADQHKILIINTRQGVSKYDIVINHFRKKVSYPITELDLSSSHMTPAKIQSTCSKPDIKLIYCVGSKGCKVSSPFHLNKKIVFSSVINWQHILPKKSNKIYGVSNEFNSEMILTLFRLFVSDIDDIGIIYSDQYNKEWIEELKFNAKKVNINIIAQKISQRQIFYQTMTNLLQKIKVFWLISDPVVMTNKNHLHEITYLCNQYNVPIFSYNSVFIDYGVTLTVSTDLPTVGGQAAFIANNIMADNVILNKIQYPAGSYISVNMSLVKKYHLNLNNDAYGLINNIKE
jgi:putative ABC transport system substrate-binding protein